MAEVKRNIKFLESRRSRKFRIELEMAQDEERKILL